MSLPGGQTVTVIPPSTTDRNGDPVAAASPFAVDGVGIAVIGVGGDGVSESLDRRSTTVSRVVLEFPPGTTIPMGSHFTLPLPGAWRMHGIPSAPRNPLTGWSPGVKIEARAVI